MLHARDGMRMRTLCGKALEEGKFILRWPRPEDRICVDCYERIPRLGTLEVPWVDQGLVEEVRVSDAE